MKNRPRLFELAAAGIGVAATAAAGVLVVRTDRAAGTGPRRTLVVEPVRPFETGRPVRPDAPDRGAQRVVPPVSGRVAPAREPEPSLPVDLPEAVESAERAMFLFGTSEMESASAPLPDSAQAALADARRSGAISGGRYAIAFPVVSGGLSGTQRLDAALYWEENPSVQERSTVASPGLFDGDSFVVASSIQSRDSDPLLAGDRVLASFDAEVGTGDARRGYYAVTDGTISGLGVDVFPAASVREIPSPRAETSGDRVLLTWDAAGGDGQSGDANVLGYNVYRSTDGESFEGPINPDVLPIPFFVDGPLEYTVSASYAIRLVYRHRPGAPDRDGCYSVDCPESRALSAASAPVSFAPALAFAR